MNESSTFCEATGVAGENGTVLIVRVYVSDRSAVVGRAHDENDPELLAFVATGLQPFEDAQRVIVTPATAAPLVDQ